MNLTIDLNGVDPVIAEVKKNSSSGKFGESQ